MHCKCSCECFCGQQFHNLWKEIGDVFRWALVGVGVVLDDRKEF